MRKHVVHDRGERSAGSHMIRAICAALIWHVGHLEETIELVANFKAGIAVTPSNEFKAAWSLACKKAILFEPSPAKLNSADLDSPIL